MTGLCTVLKTKVDRKDTVTRKDAFSLKMKIRVTNKANISKRAQVNDVSCYIVNGTALRDLFIYTKHIL